MQQCVSAKCTDSQRHQELQCVVVEVFVHARDHHDTKQSAQTHAEDGNGRQPVKLRFLYLVRASTVFFLVVIMMMMVTLHYPMILLPPMVRRRTIVGGRQLMLVIGSTDYFMTLW
uniref:Uncharacterized protein n=1 Tax=Anopheles atroparvus TaxID=41427 RepID=A0A182J728_ANOAO